MSELAKRLRGHVADIVTGKPNLSAIGNVLSDAADAIENASGGEKSFPHARKVGRYVFFAACALGCGASLGAFAMHAGLSAAGYEMISSVAGLAAFLALRDMSKAGWR